MGKLNKKIKKNGGMTYVELIVVLSIFAVMTSIVLFNYNKYEDQVNIKVLANDIALEIVQAQNSAISGELSSLVFSSKPSYGVYFDSSSGNNKSFFYFADINDNGFYDVPPPTVDFKLNSFSITNGNYISRIDEYSGNVATPITTPLSVTFIRPNSGANFYFNGSKQTTGFDHIQITISSVSAVTSCINVYASGRVQINQCPSAT
jgi:type II secretory pathway pseudopilin PulG